MKTIIHKSGNKRTLLTLLSFFVSAFTKAQSTNSLLNEKPKDLYISIYIIGGVLGFGIIIFSISKLMAKYQKEDEENKKKIRPISHRQHHHQRIIKKSA